MKAAAYAESRDPEAGEIVWRAVSEGPSSEAMFDALHDIATAAVRWSEMDYAHTLAVFNSIAVATSAKAWTMSYRLIEFVQHVPESTIRELGADTLAMSAEAFAVSQTAAITQIHRGDSGTPEQQADRMVKAIVPSFAEPMPAEDIDASVRYHTGLMLCSATAIQFVSQAELAASAGN